MKPSISLHQTGFPKTQPDLDKLGSCFDFAGYQEAGKKFHLFQVQVNAGNKIPTSWKEWRERHAKGTHGIVATIKVPDVCTNDDVAKALDDVEDDID